MKQQLALFILLFSQTLFSQQYDSVVIDQQDIDSNNEIYKTGNIYIFDYEIIENKI